jgi:hypothetical protein
MITYGHADENPAFPQKAVVPITVAVIYIGTEHVLEETDDSASILCISCRRGITSGGDVDVLAGEPFGG